MFSCSMLLDAPKVANAEEQKANLSACRWSHSSSYAWTNQRLNEKPEGRSKKGDLLTLILTGAKSDKAETFRTRVEDEIGVPGTLGELSPWSSTSSSAPNASEKERICLERPKAIVKPPLAVEDNSRIVHIICSKQFFCSEEMLSGIRCIRIWHGSKNIREIVRPRSVTESEI